ncbi:MAG TPA: glycosyltransferase family 4 protein [Candidatus Acidoferrales bacterium]|nr:glycosyltransferase family 4 protein [Candidatus Acidoferrales bacterium]
MHYEHALLLSFEGPDAYSLIGGLGTRVTDLAAALAAAGVQTTLLFVGDPSKPAIERISEKLEYRRWGQWISAYHPANVYDGEIDKINDIVTSVPPFVADTIVTPAARKGERVLVIAEEWQMVRATIEIDRLLRERGLRHTTALLWNANNTYGFEYIDWGALRAAAQITTVSKFMKFELRAWGIEALVVPNGIADRLLEGADPALVDALEHALPQRPLFVKIGRYDPDKRWIQAIDAFAAIHGRYPSARLIMRGGREPYGGQVLERAFAHRLAVEGVAVASREPQALIDALAATRAPIVEIRSFVPESLLSALYRVADAVIANSGKEPFGLVGLEVMASGGLAVCGSTGEEYAEAFSNAIVCDTGDPLELGAYLEMTLTDTALAAAMRSGGSATARHYTWSRILTVLSRKLRYVERTRDRRAGNRETPATGLANR